MHVLKVYVLVVPCIVLVLETTDVARPLLQQLGILVTALVFGWWLSVYLKDLYSGREMISPRKLAVFIAGCDSEHGLLTANQLARYGYHVFAGSQDVDGDTAKTLLNGANFHADVVELRPTSARSVDDAFEDVCERLHKEGKQLHALICNVGSGHLGEFEWIGDHRLKGALDETLGATARLIKRFLPLVRQERARIVICAGISGRVAIPGAGVYCVVNAALISFAECLRQEMAKFKVPVILVEPTWLNYRAPLSRHQTPETAIKEVLRNISRDVSQSYPSEYRSAFQELWHRRSTRWYMGPSDAIAACTCQAVNECVPRHRYTCSYAKERVLNTLLQYLPSYMGDILQCSEYQSFAKLRKRSEPDSSHASPNHDSISRRGLIQNIPHSSQPLKPVSRKDSGVPTTVRELLALQTAMPPKPASAPLTSASTAAPDRKSVKEEPTLPGGTTADALEPAINPPTTILELEEQPLETAKAEDVDGAPVAEEDTFQRLARRHSVRTLSFATETQDVTISPELSPDYPSRRGSCHGSPGESGEADTEDGVLLLRLIWNTQCDLLASSIADVKPSARDLSGASHGPLRTSHMAAHSDQLADHVATNSATYGHSTACMPSSTELIPYDAGTRAARRRTTFDATAEEDTFQRLARRHSVRTLSFATETHDVTISPDLSPDYPSRRGSRHGSPDESGEADTEDGVLLLRLISNTQCDLLASSIAAGQPSAKDSTGALEGLIREAHMAVQSHQIADHITSDSATNSPSSTAYGPRCTELVPYDADTNALQESTAPPALSIEGIHATEFITEEHSLSPIDSAEHSISPANLTPRPCGHTHLDSLESIAFLAHHPELDEKTENVTLPLDSKTKKDIFGEDPNHGSTEERGKESKN